MQIRCRMPTTLRSRLVAAMYPKFASEDLILNAVSKSITAGGSIKKHTKLDKGGLLPNSWWHPSLFSGHRIQTTIQHMNCLAVTPVSKTVSSGLPTSGDEMLGILSFPPVGHRIGSAAEYYYAASFSSSESPLVPAAAELDCVCFACPMHCGHTGD